MQLAGGGGGGCVWLARKVGGVRVCVGGGGLVRRLGCVCMWLARKGYMNM